MNKSSIRLSVCIPTYNFGAFIGETLDSIIQNMCDDVEIVILDGGSTDDTARVVAEKSLKCPRINYFFQNFRGGIDRDIARAVELSHGTYCWLFSADDIMKPGALSFVLHAMDSGCDIYLCEQTLCTENMVKIRDHPIFKHIRKPEVFDLSDPAQKKKYFSEARTSEAFFSYLSGPVFKRQIWDQAAGIPDAFNDTCWGLAGRLLSRIPHGLKIQYLGVSLINKRSGVDSFMDKGLVHRLRITVEGFAFIASSIFGENSYETWHIRRVTRNEDAFRFRRLVSVKIIILTTSEKENRSALKEVVRKHYSKAGLLNQFRFYLWMLFPVPVLIILKSVKDMLKFRQAISS